MIGIFSLLFLAAGRHDGGGVMVFALRRYWSGTKKRQRIHMTLRNVKRSTANAKPPFLDPYRADPVGDWRQLLARRQRRPEGIGPIMLVLIGVAPAGFVVKMNAPVDDITRTRDAVTHLQQHYQQHGDALSHAVSLTPLVPSPDDEAAPGKPAEFHCDSSRAMPAIELAQGMLTNLQSYDQLTVAQSSSLRRLLMCVTDTADKVAKLPGNLIRRPAFLKNLRQDLLQTVEYAPMWDHRRRRAGAVARHHGWAGNAWPPTRREDRQEGMTYAQGAYRPR